jgi:hypothetical protein
METAKAEMTDEFREQESIDTTVYNANKGKNSMKIMPAQEVPKAEMTESDLDRLDYLLAHPGEAGTKAYGAIGEPLFQKFPEEDISKYL